MADSMRVDVGQDLASGAEGMQKFLETVGSSDIMAKASKEAGGDMAGGPGTQTPQDLTKTYSMAAQMAAQRGMPGLSDKFNTKAQSFAKGDLENKQEQVKLQLAKFDQFERTLEGINTHDDAVTAIQQSDLPDDQKLRMISQVPKDEAGLKAWRTQVGRAAMSQKDRLLTDVKVKDEEIKMLKAQAYADKVGRNDRRVAQAKEAPQWAVKQTAANLQDDLSDVQKTDAKGNLVPLSENDYKTMAKQIEDRGRQLYKSGDYETLEDAVQEAKGEVLDKYIGEGTSQNTILGIGVGGKETFKKYDPSGAKKPAQAAPKKSEFVEGKVYQDAKGNKAKYVNGKFVPV